MTDERDFLGSWRLVSFETRGSTGWVKHPFGDDADGVITYSPDRRLSAMLWQSNRTPFSVNDQLAATPEEYAAAVQTVVQYVGTFELGPGDGTIVHRIEQSIFPNLNGVDQLRYFDIDPDRLVLRTPPVEFGGDTVVSSISWRRATST